MLYDRSRSTRPIFSAIPLYYSIVLLSYDSKLTDEREQYDWMPEFFLDGHTSFVKIYRKKEKKKKKKKKDDFFLSIAVPRIKGLTWNFLRTRSKCN